MLYADNDNQAVQVSIPTARTSQRANFTLITTHELTREIFALVSASASVSTYLVTASFSFPTEMPLGQYTFTLSDDDGELQRGLLQIGIGDEERTAYTPNITIKSYEYDEQ